MRTLSLLLPLSIAAFLLNLFVGFQPVMSQSTPTPNSAENIAATFTVTTPSDEDDGTCDPASCSLREAINAANANPGADVVDIGDFEVGAGLFLDIGSLEISDDLTLLCEGSLQINGGGEHRVFHIKPGAIVTMKDCSIQGGKSPGGAGIYIENATLTLIDSALHNNRGAPGGGGFQMSQATVTLSNTVVSKNTAFDSGGGIDGNGTLTIKGGSSIRENSNGQGAGAGLRFFGTLTIENSEIISNTSLGDGGGIYFAGGTLRINNTVIRWNAAENGAGIYTNGTLIITDGKIEANEATRSGGGIYNENGTITIYDGWLHKNEAGTGGGIANYQGTVHLRDNCSIFQNNALSSGGAIYTEEGVLTIDQCSIFSNTSLGVGGNLFLNEGSTTISRSSLSSGKALNAFGGGIYATGLLTMTQSSVAFNEAATGGGLYLRAPTVIHNSTINENKAVPTNISQRVPYGGGIYVDSTDLTLLNSTVVSNTAALGAGLYAIDDSATASPLVSVANSIIAQNQQGLFGFNCQIVPGMQFEGTLANLSDNTTCPDFMVGALTLGIRTSEGIGNYYPLLAGSEAIDAGDSSTCALVGNVDQLGAQRPGGAACDIGAIEQDGIRLNNYLYMPTIIN